jgi:hypothetical protein
VFISQKTAFFIVRREKLRTDMDLIPSIAAKTNFSLKITSSTNFAIELALALELVFVRDQLGPGTRLCCGSVSVRIL